MGQLGSESDRLKTTIESLGHLPEVAAVALRYTYDQDLETIGGKLNLPPTEVAGVLSKGLRMLKDEVFGK